MDASESASSPEDLHVNNQGANTSDFGVSDDFVDMSKPTEGDLREAWRLAIAKYGLHSNAPDVPVIDDRLYPKVTLQEKNAYAAILKHGIYGARIYGKPGSGLSMSSFGKREIRTGKIGESVFAKLLSRDGVLDKCVSFWSVWNPKEDGTRNSRGSDIDCILKFGSHILLVDVKQYRSGVKYHTLLPGKAMFCIYANSRVVAHEPYIFNANMAFAQRNIEHYLISHGSQCTVESFVVLVPGNAGQSMVDDDIRCPGDIPVMSYTSFLDMLNNRALQDSSYMQSVQGKTPEEGWLATLVKDYGSIPLSLLDNPQHESLWPKPSFERAVSIKPCTTPSSSSRTSFQQSNKNTATSSSHGRNGQYDQQYQRQGQQHTQNQQYAQNQYNQQYDQNQYGQPYMQQPYAMRPPYQPYMVGTHKKIVAGLLGIFLGMLGMHNFYLGYNNKAIIQLVLTLVFWPMFGLGPAVAVIWSFVEAILILVSKPGTQWHRDAQGYELQD